MLAGAQPLQHPCWCHKWVWGLKKASRYLMQTVSRFEVTTHPDGFHRCFGHWSCSLCPQLQSNQALPCEHPARQSSTGPEKVWWFRDIPSFMTSCTSVWKVLRSRLGSHTRCGSSGPPLDDHCACGTCGTCGDVNPRQDANIVADASFLRSGMDGHLDT